MAKRFTDTNKWRKDFIRGLQGAYKLLWLYILDECDHAGIWHVELDVAELRIGFKLDEKDILKSFEGHIFVFDDGNKWFIPDFIDFQYGTLNPDNRVHNSILELLEKYKLKGLIRGLQAPKDKDKELDKDIIEEKESEKKSFLQYRKCPLNIPFDNFWNLYDKKVDRKKCEIKWVRLNDSERKECIDKVPAYVFSTPDKKFRRDPETYLNNKSWENEIISPVAAKIELPKTYEEMLELTKNNPELWKQYKAVKKEGERKSIYIKL